MLSIIFLLSFIKIIVSRVTEITVLLYDNSKESIVERKEDISIPTEECIAIITLFYVRKLGLVFALLHSICVEYCSCSY